MKTLQYCFDKRELQLGVLALDGYSEKKMKNVVS